MRQRVSGGGPARRRRRTSPSGFAMRQGFWLEVQSVTRNRQLRDHPRRPPGAALAVDVDGIAVLINNHARVQRLTPTANDIGRFQDLEISCTSRRTALSRSSTGHCIERRTPCG
ncbi:hypothetical protein [Streptomyces sp. KL116D]|uniref:hypothetical protein n=1 Tax=Streptomyces sp. KL116D TaxID=3045152 RepID=UPI003555F221